MDCGPLRSLTQMAQEAHDADPAAAAAFGSKQHQKKNRLATAEAAALAASSPSTSAAPAAVSPPPIVYLSFLGSRYVRPYCHSFSFSVKKRWWGFPLRAMLEAEYKNPLSKEGFYARLIDSGRVSVLKAGAKAASSESGPRALASRLMLLNDRVTLQLHRHEPPVPDTEIIFVHQPQAWGTRNETEGAAANTDAAIVPAVAASSSPPSLQQVSLASETLVVCKPSGLPVHASGRYQWNTVVGILKQRYGIEAWRKERKQHASRTGEMAS